MIIYVGLGDSLRPPHPSRIVGIILDLISATTRAKGWENIHYRATTAAAG